MKLYMKPTSPYARKVRVVAKEVGLGDRVQMEQPPLREAGNAFWKLNPTGMIPALVTEEGELVVESDVICEYLDALGNGIHLYPVQGERRWRALKLNAFGGAVMDAYVNRVRESWRPAESQDTKALALEKERIENILSALEADPGLIADPMNIGHVTLACALSVGDRRFPDEAWREGRPALAAWYEAFNARPSMRETYAE